MNRRETRESVNKGCNCLIILVIAFAFVVSGVRSLVNGDIKLPKLGSSRVSGGSGGYGTSNGYNVKYKQTTTPNTNSSLNDYTNTNSQPTEYREGRRTQHSSMNSVDNSSSRSYGVSNSSPLNSSSSTIGNSPTITNTQKPRSYYKTCDWCKGTGKRNTFEWFYGSLPGLDNSCWRCGRTDKHRHDDIIDCDMCNGEGRIKMETINTPLGEMEVHSFE